MIFVASYACKSETENEPIFEIQVNVNKRRRKKLVHLSFAVKNCRSVRSEQMSWDSLIHIVYLICVIFRLTF